MTNLDVPAAILAEVTEQAHDNEQDPPVLPAIAVGGVWKVWCVHCRRWHIHGPGRGHRVAHCAGDGYPRGYILELAEPEAQA